MDEKYKKYPIICPIGCVLFILLALALYPLTLDGSWQWWFIEALVILPVMFLGIYLDKKVFKLKGTIAKTKQKGQSLVEKNPEMFMKCPHCDMPVRKETEYCGYCSNRVS